MQYAGRLSSISKPQYVGKQRASYEGNFLPPPVHAAAIPKCSLMLENSPKQELKGQKNNNADAQHTWLFSVSDFKVYFPSFRKHLSRI